MPIIHFHVCDTPASRAAGAALLQDASACYATVLQTPIERIRAFMTLHPPEMFLVAGELCSVSASQAPFFDFIVLDGRPLAERQRLLAEFTELCVQHLGVDRAVVRGVCRRVPPEDWGIGGVSASELRRAEIDTRARAAAAHSAT